MAAEARSWTLAPAPPPPASPPGGPAPRPDGDGARVTSRQRDPGARGVCLLDESVAPSRVVPGAGRRAWRHRGDAGEERSQEEVEGERGKWTWVVGRSEGRGK